MTNHSAFYRIFRDDTLTDRQGSALLRLQTLTELLRSTIADTAREAEDAAQRMREGQLPGYSEGVWSSRPDQANVYLIQVRAQLDLCHALDIPADKIQTVYQQSR